MRRYGGALLSMIVVGGLLYFSLGFLAQHPPAAHTRKTFGPPAKGCQANPPSTTSGHLGAVVPRPMTGRRGTLKQFAKVMGSKPSVIEYYEDFPNPLNLHQARLIYDQHAFPFFQWDPGPVPLAKITSGGYDRFLRQSARALKAFKCKIVISFGHEMNGNWYPWGDSHVKPAAYIAAYRHVHDVLTGAGVRNVIWGWTVIRQVLGLSRIVHWWPGSKYVDWIGVDGYYRHAKSNFGIFKWTFQTAHRLWPRKPVFFAETAAAPRPQEAAQVGNLFRGAAAHHVFTVVWFDINVKEPWSLAAATKPARAALPAAVRAYTGASW